MDLIITVDTAILIWQPRDWKNVFDQVKASLLGKNYEVL